MGIKWDGLSFTEPAIFNGDVSSTESGVYAIMTRPDPSNNPTSYRILYFGETEDFSQRLDSNHEKNTCWTQNQISGLYYSLYIMSNSTQDQRQTIESQLINRYNPICNKKA